MNENELNQIEEPEEELTPEQKAEMEALAKQQAEVDAREKAYRAALAEQKEALAELAKQESILAELNSDSIKRALSALNEFLKTSLPKEFTEYFDLIRLIESRNLDSNIDPFRDIRGIEYYLEEELKETTDPELQGKQLKEIISKRNKSGEFKSIDDFVIRCKGVVNKKAFEMLIKAGALDCLHNNRRSLLYGMDDLLKLAKSDSNPNQLGLFDLAPQSEYNKMTTTLPNVEEYDKETLLNFEKEATGIYISGHPLEDYIDLWRKTISHSVAQIKENEEITDGLEVTLVGQVLDYRPYVTKSGRNMAFFTLEDLTGTIEVLLFPQKYHLYSSKLADDVKIILKGRISKEEEKDTKVIVDSISDFDQKQERLVIKFANKKEFFDNQEMLNSAIVKGGNGEVVIIVEAERQQKVIRNVEINNALIDLCKNIVGEENVKYTS